MEREALRAEALVQSKRDRLGILTGMVLGDGHIEEHFGHCRLALQHAWGQRDYLLWKRELLTRIFGESPHYAEYPKAKWPNVRTRTKNSDILKRLHERFYCVGRKTITDAGLNQLTPCGIAIWYLDDGSLAIHRHPDGRPSWREGLLCTNCFTVAEQNLVRAWFKRRHDIEMKLVRMRQYVRLRFNAANANRLFKLIDPYVPTSMRYKLDMEYVYSLREQYAERSTGRPKMRSVLSGDGEKLAETTNSSGDSCR